VSLEKSLCVRPARGRRAREIKKEKSCGFRPVPERSAPADQYYFLSDFQERGSHAQEISPEITPPGLLLEDPWSLPSHSQSVPRPPHHSAALRCCTHERPFVIAAHIVYCPEPPPSPRFPPSHCRQDSQTGGGGGEETLLELSPRAVWRVHASAGCAVAVSPLHPPSPNVKVCAYARARVKCGIRAAAGSVGHVTEARPLDCAATVFWHRSASSPSSVIRRGLLFSPLRCFVCFCLVVFVFFGFEPV